MVIHIHASVRPLRLLHDIQTRVDDELVHVLRGVREAEASNTITTAFRCAEGNVEYWGICGRENSEII